MLKVAIIDDEALFRGGFELILGGTPDIEVVASTDGVSALGEITRSDPDVVLLDVRMPGRSGLDVLRDLQQWARPPATAVLTTFDTDEYIATALHLGAAGFLVKDTDPEQLPALIRSLAAGGIVLSPQVSRSLLAATRSTTRWDSRVDSLSSREREVLALLHTGASNAAIGEAMHLSSATIKDHVSSILTKLGVTSRLQAALIAERHSPR